MVDEKNIFDKKVVTVINLTYGQIKDALYQVYLKEFEPKNGRQKIAKYDRVDDVPMSEMLYSLRGVGERDFVEIR